MEKFDPGRLSPVTLRLDIVYGNVRPRLARHERHGPGAQPREFPDLLRPSAHLGGGIPVPQVLGELPELLAKLRRGLVFLRVALDGLDHLRRDVHTVEGLPHGPAQKGHQVGGAKGTRRAITAVIMR